MSAQQLFAKQAFALALGSLGLEVMPETVMTESLGTDEIDCMALYSADGSSRLAEGFFSGDEEGGRVIITTIHDPRLEQSRSFWFMAHINGTPIAVEDVTDQQQPSALVEEEELAEEAV
jgi:hypothetical protein